MMKFTLGILLTAGLALAAHLYLDYWWTVSIAAFIVGLLIGERWLSGFAYGFLGIGLLWGGYALFLDFANGSLLSRQIGQMLQGLNSYSVLGITALVGGLLGGFSAMSGSVLRSLLFPKKTIQ